MTKLQSWRSRSMYWRQPRQPLIHDRWSEAVIDLRQVNLQKTSPSWVAAAARLLQAREYMYHGDIPFDTFTESSLFRNTDGGSMKSVGKSLRTGWEKGLTENTLMVYMGDNGFRINIILRWAWTDRQKRTRLWRIDVRCPFLAQYPKTDKPRKLVQSNIVRNIDSGAPTSWKLAGLSRSTKRRFRVKSILPIYQKIKKSRVARQKYSMSTIGNGLIQALRLFLLCGRRNTNTFFNHESGH